MNFIANHGHRFLALYDFDLSSGTWSHKQDCCKLPKFELDAALNLDDGEPATLLLPVRKQLYDHYMTEARRWVERLSRDPADGLQSLEGELGELQFFALPESATRKH